MGFFEKLMNQSPDDDRRDYEQHNDPDRQAENKGVAISDRIAGQRQANRRWGKDKQPHGDD